MPEQISSYRLEGEIARGGMGIVYRGIHTVFAEVVAIKAIYPELMLSQDLRERFLNEARIQRRLQHANIVQIREFLVEGDRFYIVMEFIQGETLAQRLKQLGGPMAAGEAADIIRQALAGLASAHAQGVIHRDIKPSNIMLTREGVAKLTDFGIARGRDTAKLTQTGMAVGTAAYMSPEQIQGVKVDHRSDIYSMGVTLYEMLTGRVPFERPKDSDSDFPVLSAHTSQPPPPPRQFAPGIPVGVESAILKALAKKPEERFQSCEEFMAALSSESEPARDAIDALRAKPLASAKPLPAAPANKVVIDPITLKPISPAPSRPAPGPPALVAPMAKPAKREEPRRAWPWVVVITLLVLAVGGGIGWQFLRAQGKFKLIYRFAGHGDAVTSVAFSPYGRLLASGSVDRTIKLWDLPTRQLKQTLTGHENYVESVAFSPDGHLLASGSADKTIKIWDVASGNLKQTLKWNGNSVLAVAFGPKGQRLASGSWDGAIGIWNVESGTLTQTLTGHLAPVSSVVFSPDGRLLASGSDDKTIKLWDLASGEVVRTLSGHDGKVTCLDFSPDGHLLASGSGDTTVRIWDVAMGRLEQTLRGHNLWVRSVAFSPDGRMLASGSHDNTIGIWDVERGKKLQTLKGHQNDVESVAFSHNGEWIASGSADQTIILWGRYQ
jgi:WD40 repeat protein/tRNA A-37 threonylcarbamoyl transferase component Bud32